MRHAIARMVWVGRRRRLTIRRVTIGIVAVCIASLLVAAVASPPPAVDRIPAVPVTDPAFAGTLQALLGAAISSGNHVDLLLNGDAIFPAKLAAIRGARRSINYAEYFWAEGDVARQLAEALAERCRAGVRVNVLLDGVGALAMPAEHVETLRRASCKASP